MESSEVFKLSREMMEGEKFNAFGLHLSFIGWEILPTIVGTLLALLFGAAGAAVGILVASLGSFLVAPYINATFVELYWALKAKLIYFGRQVENEVV